MKIIKDMNNYSDFRLTMPEIIWLESEQYQQATTISDRVGEESQKWQVYLNLLGLLGLETWLRERISEHKISQKIDVLKETYHLRVGEFTIQAIATENLLDEVVTISQATISQPEQATHFYALLEIIEEEEEAIFRGLLRYDRLINYLQEHPNTDYLPLSIFDAEPNHLLFYCQYLDPEAIPLPAIEAQPNTTLSETLTVGRTKLSQWLQETIIEGWQAIDTLINPEANLAYSTRSLVREYKKGKLINLGVKVNNATMALLITVKEEAEAKLGVGVQLYPTERAKYLPPHVQLNLISKAGKTLQSVQAREQDNYIQLKPFKGQLGKRFGIEITLGEASIREDFEL